MAAALREPIAPRTRAWTAGLLLAVLVAIGAGRIAAVEGLLPYSQHVDETFFTVSIVKMVRNGDANPHFFRYPSLPLYLSTGVMLASAPFLEDEDLADLDPAAVGLAYTPPGLYAAPRIMLALLSVAALGLLAFVAYTLSGPAAAVLTPLLVSLSGTVQVSSVQYLNVDVVTVFFVAATLAVVLGRWRDPGLLAKSVWPGLLSGMVVASKYNSGLVLVPCALAIYWAGEANRLRKLVLLGATAAVAFFVCVPYSLLDAGFFVEQILYEIEHYRTGQGFANSEPGVRQLLFYLAALANDFGWPLMALAAFGVVHGVTTDRARTLTLASMPVLMLLHMSTNSVNFVRSILPVYALVGVMQAMGIVAVWRLVARALCDPKRDASVRGRLATALAGVLAAALVVGVALSVEWTRLLDRNVAPDPRNRAVAWLRDRVEPDEHVWVAADLRMAEHDLDAFGAALLSPDLTDLAPALGLGFDFALDPGDEPGPRGRVDPDAFAARASDRSGWLLVPAYAPPRVYASEPRPAVRRAAEQRAQAVEGRLRTLKRRGDVRVALEVPGRSVEVSRRRGAPARPVRRPAVHILAIGGTAPEEAPDGRGTGSG